MAPRKGASEPLQSFAGGWVPCSIVGTSARNPGALASWRGGPSPSARLLHVKAGRNQLSGAIPDVIAFLQCDVDLCYNQLVSSLGVLAHIA